jgi:hypothetical protein
MMNFKVNFNLISSFLHLTTTKTKIVVKDQFNNFVEIPYKWIEDIKHLEFNELLSSSLGPLTLYFGWKKKQKEQFAELASGSLSSSFINGDPLTALASISILAFKFNESKNKNDLRKLKWGVLKGGVSIGFFAATTKIMGLSILSFLIGSCAFFAIKKTVTIFRLFEYLKFLKKLTIKFPKLKKEISRRDFLTLELFKKN